MWTKNNTIQFLLFIVIAWYGFCIFILNPNKGMIDVRSTDLIFYIKDLDLKTKTEVMKFLDASTVPEISELSNAKYDEHRWRIYYHDWIEQVNETEWIWNPSSKNQYQVVLSGSEENWSITFTPLQDYVYLHDLWYRMATLDVYKIECKQSRYDSATGETTVTRNKT